MDRQNTLQKVVQSNVWVGNEILTNAIWREWKEIANGDLSALSAEFLHASVDELSQEEANITLETVTLLHDAGYWRNNTDVLGIIFEYYVRLDIRRGQSGSEEFWLNLLEGDETALMQWGGHDVNAMEPVNVGRGANAQDFKRLGELYHQHVIRFNVDAIAHDVEFLRYGDEFDGRHILTCVLQDVIRRIVVGCNPDDMVDMEIRHPSLQKRIIVPFVRAQFMTAEYVMGILEKVVQSNEDFAFDENIHLTVVIVEALRGGGNRNKVSKTRIVNWDEWFTRHCGHGGCFIQV